jgi:hypothetical protein
MAICIYLYFSGIFPHLQITKNKRWLLAMAPPRLWQWLLRCQKAIEQTATQQVRIAQGMTPHGVQDVEQRQECMAREAPVTLDCLDWDDSVMSSR